MKDGANLDIDPSCKLADAQCYTQLELERKKVKYPVMYLNEIVGALKKMNWPVSAQMMKRWFDNPEWEMTDRTPRNEGILFYTKLRQTNPERVDNTTITMDWARGYPQVTKAIEEMTNTWNTVKGRKRLVDLLKRAKWSPGMPWFEFGDRLGDAIVQEDNYYVNNKPFGGYWETMNDYYGAVLFANLRIALTGRAFYDSATKKDYFDVKEMGFYLKDTWDFNSVGGEDETIGVGVWSRDRVLSKAETAQYYTMRTAAMGSTVAYILFIKQFAGFVPVKNADFGRWRDKNKTGGDYYVFSDIYWVKPKEYIRIELPL